jgi:site-specific recombinase XerD
MLATGIREQELCSLVVSDLYETLGEQPALLVREGKGAKQRLIPYGDMIGARAIVERWLRAAGISEGVVFRGFYQGKRALRHTGLDVRSVQRILERYPIAMNGKTSYARPHDLRRTYARRLFDAGVESVAIQQNLGHSDLKTTLGYIGSLDVDRRKPPSVFDFGRVLQNILL